MVSFRRWLWCITVCMSAAGFARGPKPSLIPVPLTFKQIPPGFSKEDREMVQREYIRLLRLAGALIPDFGRYELALKDLDRDACERDDDCLAQFARKGESLYSVYASVDFSAEGDMLISGRVVRDDGRPASTREKANVTKGADSYKEMAKHALIMLFTQLKIGDLPATREAELTVKAEPSPPDAPKSAQVEPAKVEAAPATAVANVASETPRRTWALVPLVGGAAMAATGALMLTIANVNANRIHASIGISQALQRTRDAEGLGTTGLVLLGAGVATAATGAILYFSRSGPVQSVVFVTPQGGYVGVWGAFR